MNNEIVLYTIAHMAAVYVNCLHIKGGRRALSVQSRGLSFHLMTGTPAAGLSLCEC